MRDSTASPKTTDDVVTRYRAALMGMSLDSYRSPDQRAAMRGALSDAAHLCDAIAQQIEIDNPGRGKGKVSAIGQHSAHIARSCSHAIWAMREKVKVDK